MFKCTNASDRTWKQLASFVSLTLGPPTSILFLPVKKSPSSDLCMLRSFTLDFSHSLTICYESRQRLSIFIDVKSVLLLVRDGRPCAESRGSRKRSHVSQGLVNRISIIKDINLHSRYMTDERYSNSDSIRSNACRFIRSSLGTAGYRASLHFTRIHPTDRIPGKKSHPGLKAQIMTAIH